MAAAAAENNCLRVGDYVTLRNVKFDSFLCGEGILMDDLVINDALKAFDDAVFCIHLQRQYSASIELDEFLESYVAKMKMTNHNPAVIAAAIAESDDPSTQKYLHALKRCLYNENVLNESYMKQKIGRPVVFGDIIQLFHVKSQKYLTITNDQLAKEERENMRIELHGKGSPFSWCQLSPRYKIDRDGDKILTNTELYLKVAERPNEFVHASERESFVRGTPEGTHIREVNCSLESSSWRLSIFQSSTDSMDKYMLLASQIVTIQDPETKSVLMIGTAKLENLDDETAKGGSGGGMDDSMGGAGMTGGTGMITEEGEGEEERGDGEEEGAPSYFHEHGDIVLRPVGGGLMDTNAYWILESQNSVGGGPIVWKTDRVRFRHLNSGKYLLLNVVEEEVEAFDEEQSTELAAQDGPMMQDHYIYTTTTDAALHGTLFQVHELYNARAQLGNTKPLQISQDGVWMERGMVHDEGGEDDSPLCFMIKGNAEKDSAISLILNRFTGMAVDDDEDDANSKKDKAASGGGDQYDLGNTLKEPLDVHVGVASRQYLARFLDLTVVPKSDTVSTIWPGADSADMEFFIMLMTRLNNFCQGFPIASLEINTDVDKADPKIRQKRQYQLQEQRVIEVVLRIIARLVDISTQAVTIANLLKFNKHVSEDRINCNRMGQRVLKLCFEVIYSAIQDHPDNQMYVADFLPVLLAHLSVQPLAGKCVTEMLNKNMELQETKIGKREITIFINQLKEARMNAMYLGLLQSCCSCQGDGVDGNQRMVALMLFDETSDMIIKVHPDYAKLTQIDWNIPEDSLYIPYAPIAGSPVMGDGLLIRGLPMLSLTWTTNSIDYSPLGLFGKLSVPIDDLYRRNGISSGNLGAAASGGGKNSKLLAKKAVSMEQKKAVADYFIAEMYLAAEMLMDRNYVALAKLVPLFSFDVLVTMLKLDVDDNLKAASTRLLMYLYIDTDPQFESTIPCLTRPWSEIAMNDEPKLPFVEPIRMYQFGIIQHLLSEHIQGLQGTKWTRLSLSMFEVLRMLVSFNFYGSQERMLDIIDPLIVALDRRMIDYGAGAGADNSHNASALKKDNVASNSAVAVPPVTYGIGGDADKAEIELFGEDGSHVGGLAYTDQRSTWTRMMDYIASIEWLALTMKAKTFVDSMRVMIFVLALVLVAVVITIMETITGDVDPTLANVQLAILAVFCLELFTRYTTYMVIYASQRKFWRSWYNIIDVLVVGIDIVFLLAPTDGGGAGKYASILRLIRLVRLVRLLKAARVVVAIIEDVDVAKAVLISATRYTKSPVFELDAMVQAIEILLLCQNNIEDRNVSLLLRHFYKWESGDERRTPSELFNEVMEEADELCLHSDNSDAVFIDLIMFVHPPLVQRTLDVLMAHYTRRRTLLQNAENVQLLVSARRERQYKLIDQMLFQLDLNVETHELWGELENESHHATNKQTIDMLTELIDVCCIRRVCLDPQELQGMYVPDVEIQHLLRNLGCVSTCLKVIKLLEGVEEEEDEEGEGEDASSEASGKKDKPVRINEAGLNIMKLATLANTLLYWFFLDNPINQELGYSELDTFVEILDMNVKAHWAIRAIFHGNEKLMKLVPHSYIDLMVERICKEGRNPVYLSMLSAITNVGEKNFTENQYDIAKQITDISKAHKISSFIVPLTHADYARKVELMEPLKDAKNVNMEDLPMELHYHCRYLEVVASCTVGSMNTTIVEAKIQASFDYIDILQAILDPRTITLVRIYLALFYYNGIIDVAMEVPGLEHSAYVWKHIQTVPDVLEVAMEELANAGKNAGIHAPEVDRQAIEYAMLCVRIVCVFFKTYYEPMMFKMMEDREEEDSAGRFVQMKPAEADALFLQLFNSFKAMYQLNSQFLSKSYKRLLYDAMTALMENTLAVTEGSMDGLKALSNPAAAAAAAAATEGSGDAAQEEEEEEDIGAANDSDTILERRILKKYKEFISSIKNDEAIQHQQTTESLPFIAVIEALPYLKDKHIAADVRYETLIRKLVQHTRSKIEVVSNGNEKRLDPQCSLTSTWLMQAFRTMIENRWGMDIYQRDEDGGEEEDEIARDLVEALNFCGTTALCIDVIAVGIDPDLQNAAMYFGVAMLLREGGALEIQETIYNFLSKTDSELFFKQIRSTVNKLILWHQWRGAEEEEEEENEKAEGAAAGAAAPATGAGAGKGDAGGGEGEEEEEEDDDEVELPNEIIILRFLQLFSEGHYKPNQDIMREQPNNHSSINLLDCFVEYFKCLSLLPCRTSTNAAIVVTNLILEIIQGPCEKNQEYLVLNTELIETLNRVLRAKVIRDCVEEEEIELKKTCIDIFQGLLEGQSLRGAVYERVFSVIHFDVLQSLSKPPPEEEPPENALTSGFPEDDETPPVKEISEDEEIMQTESRVLLQMLCNYKPSLRKELLAEEEESGGGKEKDQESANATGCIEVVWRGEIMRKFFHIPHICRYVAKSSKDNVVFEVDRSNAENQLLDFVERAKVLHMEVQHQEVLISYGLDKVFNRSNQEYATWFAFFLAVLINALLVVYYTLTEDRVPVLSTEANTIINAINILQLITASFTFVMFLLVRCPVKYQVYEQEGYSKLKTAFLTAMDFHTLYYFGYCIIALLGLVHENYWSTFLLLDLLMKNSTARDVVKAVYNPIKSLTMSLVFLFIVVYIFSVIVFFNFRTDLQPPNETMCFNMFECFKAHFDLGLRHVNFIAELMHETFGWRALLDVIGFAGVKTLLLNLVFGIIIESFAQLREENDEKRDKIINSCFICGIDKETFDRAADGVDGFKTHITKDHHMWNYLYFLIFIWEQDKDDDDGLELYIRGCLERFDVSWLPIGKALRLSDKIDEDEELNNELQTSIKHVSKSLALRIQTYQLEVGTVIEGLATMLKNDNIAGAGGVAKSIAKHLQALTGVTAVVPATAPSTPGVNLEGSSSMGDMGALLTNDGDEKGHHHRHHHHHGHDSAESGTPRSERLVRLKVAEIVVSRKHVPDSLLEGVPFDEFLSGISCRIVTDIGIFTVTCESVVSSKQSRDGKIHIKMKPMYFIVAEDCSSVFSEHRTVNLQILCANRKSILDAATASASATAVENTDSAAAAAVSSTTAAGAAGRGSVTSKTKFLGVVEVPVMELMQGSETAMDFFFDTAVAGEGKKKATSIKVESGSAAVTTMMAAGRANRPYVTVHTSTKDSDEDFGEVVANDYSSGSEEDDEGSESMYEGSMGGSSMGGSIDENDGLQVI